jgi:hypothetical protein
LDAVLIAGGIGSIKKGGALFGQGATEFDPLFCERISVREGSKNDRLYDWGLVLDRKQDG